MIDCVKLSNEINDYNLKLNSPEIMQNGENNKVPVVDNINIHKESNSIIKINLLTTTNITKDNNNKCGSQRTNCPKCNKNLSIFSLKRHVKSCEISSKNISNNLIEVKKEISPIFISQPNNISKETISNSNIFVSYNSISSLLPSQLFERHQQNLVNSIRQNFSNTNIYFHQIMKNSIIPLCTLDDNFNSNFIPSLELPSYQIWVISLINVIINSYFDLEVSLCFLYFLLYSFLI
jgi:hypothetical protein